MGIKLVKVRHIIARCSRFVWRAFQAFTTLIFGLFALVLIAIAIGVGLEQRGPEIPEGGALVLNPSGVLVDQKNAVDPATMVLQGGDTQQQTLVKDVIDALDLAKNDDRIGLVVLDLDKLGHGLIPKLLRIASAIDNFKTSGKKVIAVANNYSQSALLLAAHADEVLLNPEGIALPEGYSMHRTYYKSLLENTDVSVNIYKVGKYKSAMEPYFRDSMSEEDREARLAILDTWWSAYTSRIETQRGIDEGRIDNILQDAPNQIRLAQGNLARLSLDNGLVDRLLTSNEQRDYLMEVAGENADTDEYKRIGFNHYLTVARLPTANKDNKVAVITAVGPIVDGKAPAGEIGSQSLSRLIRKARLNDDVKAIVLRVDSGGGSKTASEIIRQELLTAQESGIPVVASFGSVAASGGYWISATADEIWASPTTVTGSIGIFGMLLSFENTLARYGISSDGVATTPLAGGVSIERGVSPEYGESIQLVLEAGYQQFLTTVAQGREMDVDAVHEVAQGRIWTGEKAQQLGLVDQLGNLEQAIESAASLANIEDYSVWYVEPPLALEEKLLRRLLARVSGILSSGAADPITHISNRVRQELGFLSRLNDPANAYVICGSCPVVP